MAYPKILFDRDTGVDDDTTSGAGPAVAVSGTKARNRTGGSTTIGLYEASAPDLSLVAVDGSHAVRVATGSGRKWAKITAKKETVQTPVGSMNGSTGVVTSTDTTGIVSGDAFMVPGAGAASADLYSTVATIDSGTQLTLNNASSTSVSGVTCQCPKNIRVSTSITLTADTAWGIGGRRNAPMNATEIPVDVLPGWKVRFVAGTFQMFAFTSAWVFAVGGDSTDGPITIEGEINSSGRRPRVGGTSSVSPFTIRAPKIRIVDVAFDQVDSCVLVDSSNASDLYCRGLLNYDSNYGLRLTSAATGSRFRLENSDFAAAVTMPVSIEGAVTGVSVEACSFCRISFGGGAKNLVARKNLFAGPAGAGSLTGILIDTASAAVGVVIDGNVFRSLLEGVRVKDANGAQGIVVRNNDFSINGTGIKSDVTTFDNVAAFCDYNNFFGNTTDRSNVLAGANDTAVDPAYRSGPPSSAPDVRPGISMRGTGWPKSVGVDSDPGALSATVSFPGIGCVQRREFISGLGVARISSVVDLGNEVEVAYVVLGLSGEASSAGLIQKSSIPAVGFGRHEAVMEVVAAAIRDLGIGNISQLVGQEVQV